MFIFWSTDPNFKSLKMLGVLEKFQENVHVSYENYSVPLFYVYPNGKISFFFSYQFLRECMMKMVVAGIWMINKYLNYSFFRPRKFCRESYSESKSFDHCALNIGKIRKLNEFIWTTACLYFKNIFLRRGAPFLNSYVLCPLSICHTFLYGKSLPLTNIF